MKSPLRFVTLFMVLGALCGCGHYVRPDPAAGYPYRAISDIKFAWGAAPYPSGLTVQGVLKNSHYARVEDLDLYVMLMDRDNRELERKVFFPIPQPIAMDDWRQFTVVFHQAPPEGARLQFLYKYVISDGSEHFRWQQGFRAELATGAILRNENEEPPSRF